MIRLGIVGCNFGRSVHLPAFRSDGRCKVVGLAGTDKARVESLAREHDIEIGFSDWAELVDHKNIDAVTIATPPALQPLIALRALAQKKPVFVEKPFASDLAAAARLVDAANASGLPTMIDFEFPEILAWRRAKALIDDGAVGRLRHVIVSWNVENAATRLRLKNWKTNKDTGGGVLGNFACHCLHYVEWFCGPLRALSARLFALPGSDSVEESTAAIALEFCSGAAGSLSVSCASYAGSGHRVEFYGEDGTLTLINEGADYMRGFRLVHARRPNGPAEISVNDPLDVQFDDGRIAPVSRLAGRFLDAIERSTSPRPSFADGYRVQQLMEAVRRSHDRCSLVDVLAEGMR